MIQGTSQFKISWILLRYPVFIIFFLLLMLGQNLSYYMQEPLYHSSIFGMLIQVLAYISIPCALLIWGQSKAINAYMLNPYPNWRIYTVIGLSIASVVVLAGGWLISTFVDSQVGEPLTVSLVSKGILALIWRFIIVYTQSLSMDVVKHRWQYITVAMLSVVAIIAAVMAATPLASMIWQGEEIAVYFMCFLPIGLILLFGFAGYLEAAVFVLINLNSEEKTPPEKEHKQKFSIDYHF